MEKQKYLIYLLGFEVTLQDRRNREITGGFIVVPFPVEHPDELQDAHDTIHQYFNRLGYDVKEIKHQDSKELALDLLSEYEAAPTTNQEE